MIAWPRPPRVAQAVPPPLPTLDERTSTQPSHSAPDVAPPAAEAREANRAGVASYARGDLTGAASAFAQAVEANPEDAGALNNLGQMLVRQGRPADALVPLLKAVALDPASWTYRFNLARARGLTGDWAGAVEDYRRADALFPDDYPTLYNLALALQKANHADEALPVLERVAALQPEEASFQLTLGMAYEAARRGQDAVAAYSRFLDLAPQSSQAPAVRAHLARLQPPLDGPQAVPGALPSAQSLSDPRQ